MNLNHDPDKHLLEQIDQRLKSGQSSGNMLLDELASTRPIPRPTAQHALEERLLTHLELQNQGENSMASTTSYMSIEAPRRDWLPLTLLAALIVVAIAGLMLINGIGKSPKVNEMALAQVTTTSTMIPSPVPSEKSPTIQPTSPAVHKQDAVQIRLSALTTDSLLPGVGGSADVIALLPFKANTNLGDIPSTLMPDGTHFVETYVLQNTLVLYHGDRTHPDSTVTISVSPNESRILAWLAEQPQVMFRLQKPLPNAFDFSADTTIVSIPIGNVTASENFQPGDRVNVISTCAFVPNVIGTNNTVISSKTDCSQPVEEIRAVNALIYIGEIVVKGRQPVMVYDSIALFVPKDAVTLFTKLNDAKMHFKLVPATKANQLTLTQTPIPSTASTATPPPTPERTTTQSVGSRIINLPLDHLDFNSQEITRGDSVDVFSLCAFIAETTEGNNTVTPAHTDCSQKVETQVINAGLVLYPYLNLNPNNTTGNLGTLSLAVSWNEEAQLGEMINAGMIFKLVKTANPYIPTATPIGVPLTQVIFDIPLDTIDSVTEPLQVGDSVEIYTTCSLSDNSTSNNVMSSKTDCTKAVEQQETFGSVVKMNSTLVTISIPYQEQIRFSHMIMGGMHFKLVKSSQVSQLTPTPLPIPKGRVTVDVPLDSFTTKEQSEKLQVGDYVDVVATVLTFESQTPVSTMRPATLQPQETPGLRTQRIVSDALIIKTGDVITLAVSPDAAPQLQNWLTAKVPIILHPVDPAMVNSGGNSPLTLKLMLDSVEHWAVDDIQVGDKADVVMGFVAGTGDSVKLMFKPYGTLTWDDALSKYEVHASIYAPTNVKPDAEHFFIHRVIQNAEVIAIDTHLDPNSGHMSTLDVVVELPNSMTLTDLNTINDYIQAGMPYLVVKH